MGVSTTHRINLSMWILIYSFSDTYYVWAACGVTRLQVFTAQTVHGSGVHTCPRRGGTVPVKNFHLLLIGSKTCMDPCKWCLRVFKVEGYARGSCEGLSLTLVLSLISFPLPRWGKLFLLDYSSITGQVKR